MQDPLEAYNQAVTCPFCRTKFSDVIKLIPDCGSFICGACFDELSESLDGSKRFKCRVCDHHHVLPENGLWNCKMLLNLVRHPIEKPLNEQAKKLRLRIENVQEELSKLDSFDPRELLEHRCVQLEHEISLAAESAVKHIHEIEAGLLKQIKEYHQRCLDSFATQTSQSPTGQLRVPLSNEAKLDLDSLTKEIRDFNSKWNDYFKRLNALASDSELEAAISQTDTFRARIRTLDQEITDQALSGKFLQLNLKASFFAARDHLGGLVETSTVKVNQKTSREIRIQKPTRRLSGHSACVRQAICLPGGRLASCSFDKTIKVWDTKSDSELFTLRGHRSAVLTMAFLPNGCLASGSSDKTIKLWDLDEQKEVRTLEEHGDLVVSLKVLKNGNLASYSHDNTMKIWNPYLDKNNLLLTITGHGNSRGFIPFDVLSSDHLVTCSRVNNDQDDKMLKVWDSNAGKLVKSVGIDLKAVWPLFVLSNDQIALGTANDGTIKIVDLEDESKTRTKARAHDKKVTCLLQLSNGNLVSAGIERDWASLDDRFYSLKVWNTTDLSLLQRIKTGHDIIYSLSINEDETMFVSGSWDKSIELWPTNIKDTKSS